MVFWDAWELMNHKYIHILTQGTTDTDTFMGIPEETNHFRSNGLFPLRLDILHRHLCELNQLLNLDERRRELWCL